MIQPRKLAFGFALLSVVLACSANACSDDGGNRSCECSAYDDDKHASVLLECEDGRSICSGGRTQKCSRSSSGTAALTPTGQTCGIPAKPDASIPDAGKVTPDAGQDASAPKDSGVDSGFDAGPCILQTCTTDAECGDAGFKRCLVVPGGTNPMRCFENDDTAKTCTSHAGTTPVPYQCMGDALNARAACVPAACTDPSQRPVANQDRECH